MQLGYNEVEYNYNFRFYKTTKLNNPHYSPEIACKTTIVNFAVILQGIHSYSVSQSINQSINHAFFRVS